MVHELPEAGVEQVPVPRAEGSRLCYGRWLGVTQERDAAETTAVLSGKDAEWLIVDHYALDRTWETLVRPHVRKLMVIDDLADRPHDCDVLLDQNFRLEGDSRYGALVPPPCTRLIGPRYALLRSEFAEVRRRIKRRAGPVRRVLVFLGGSDPDNVTGRALEALTAPELGDLEVDVVIGAGSPHAADIGRRVAERPRTTLHVQVRNMAELMARADLALGAGGSATWERLSVGLPSLVVTIAENQRRSTEDLDLLGLLKWIGGSETVGVPELRDALRNAVNRSRNRDDANVRAGMDLVDGAGAARVADLLMHGVSPERWKTRSAIASDCELYWHWANDSEVRRNAFHQEDIPWETHERWFQGKLADPATTMLLIESEVGPVGQVRLQDSGAELTIDYSLGRQFRGLGLGSPLLARAIEMMERRADVTLVGDVKADNQASAKVFEKLGFTEESTAEPHTRRFRMRKGMETRKPK